MDQKMFNWVTKLMLNDQNNKKNQYFLIFKLFIRINNQIVKQLQQPFYTISIIIQKNPS